MGTVPQGRASQQTYSPMRGKRETPYPNERKGVQAKNWEDRKKGRIKGGNLSGQIKAKSWFGGESCFGHPTYAANRDQEVKKRIRKKKEIKGK